jgi:hypothetical protein
MLRAAGSLTAAGTNPAAAAAQRPARAAVDASRPNGQNRSQRPHSRQV